MSCSSQVGFEQNNPLYLHAFALNPPVKSALDYLQKTDEPHVRSWSLFKKYGLNF